MVSGWSLCRPVAGPTEVVTLPLKRAWTFQATDPIKATACIAGGKVYIGDGDGKMFCLNAADGDKVWEFQTEGPIEGSACVVEGLVVFGSGDGFVYALDATTGKERWKFTVDDDTIESAPTVALGRGFFGACGATRVVDAKTIYDQYTHRFVVVGV